MNSHESLESPRMTCGFEVQGVVDPESEEKVRTIAARVAHELDGSRASTEAFPVQIVLMSEEEFRRSIPENHPANKRYCYILRDQPDDRVYISARLFDELPDDAEAMIRHEMNHISVAHEVGDMNAYRGSFFLEEGTAGLERSTERLVARLAEDPNSTIPDPLDYETLDALKAAGNDTDKEPFTRQIGYLALYSFVDFLKERYGQSEVIELYKQMGTGMNLTTAFENRYATPLEAVINEWKSNVAASTNAARSAQADQGSPRQGDISAMTGSADTSVVEVEGRQMKIVGYTAPEGTPGRMSILEETATESPVGSANDTVSSEAEEVKQEPPYVLSDEETRAVARSIRDAGTATERKFRLRQIASRKGLTPEQLQREVNLRTVAEIKQNEKGELRHYHRTSIENVISMIQTGRMLSRTKLKELNPGIQIPGWSSSDNVLMTRDMFNAEGELVMPGHSETDNLGASGGGALMIFKDSIMGDETYNALERYPAVSDTPVAEHCEVILVDSEEDRIRLEHAMQEGGLPIPLMLKSDWKK